MKKKKKEEAEKMNIQQLKQKNSTGRSLEKQMQKVIHWKVIKKLDLQQREKH